TELPQIAAGGLTGGPVLDEKGEVMGIMVEGLPGTGTHYAVPATQLVELLDETREQAAVLFDTPPIAYGDRRSSFDLRFEVACRAPLPASAVVEVVFEGRRNGVCFEPVPPGRAGSPPASPRSALSIPTQSTCWSRARTSRSGSWTGKSSSGKSASD